MGGKVTTWLGKRWLLALSGGLLMCLAWEFDLWPFLFVAWLPWLHLLRDLVHSRTRFWKTYGYTYLAVFVWNALSVWWIQGATLGGMIGAVVAMAACMALVLTLVVQGWQRFGNAWGTAALLVGWIGFEYFFHNSEISWPWLTLGNGLASASWAVQWYEYTGILGGSLWILLFNLLLYHLLVGWKELVRKARLILLTSTVLLLFVPFVLSYLLTPSVEGRVEGRGEGIEVVIVQPNVDPWNEKFSALTDEQQVERMLSLASEKMTSQTRLLVMPETAIPSNIWIQQIDVTPAVERIRSFLHAYPQCRVLVGTTLLQYQQSKERPSKTARSLSNDGDWYDAYNAALWLGDSVGDTQYYFKSKLVVGVEMLPYPQFFRFLDKLSINLGGMVGSLGTQEHRTVFKMPDNMGVAPIICYESVFGDFCTEYVRNGANLLAIITNDGWWGDTPGYKNHFNYAKLRAIETRRWLVRSANTGISGVIDPAGNVHQRLGWWLQGVIRSTVYPQSQQTFYVRWGDYLGRASYFCILGLIIGGFVARFRARH